jgi:hypothetical protein
MQKSGASIIDCQSKECSFNHEGKCRTIAINVGGPEPLCDTFVNSSIKGGLLSATAKVGACKVDYCAHNKALECAIDAIHVVSRNGQALCGSFLSGV